MNKDQNNFQLVPTDAELEILKVLFIHGPQTVRFVNDEINKNREVGYTTTLKFMQLMLDKKLLTRDIIDRSHIYKPVITEHQTQNLVLSEMLDRAFRGSASTLVMNLLGNQNTSVEELHKIKELIAELENKNKSI